MKKLQKYGIGVLCFCLLSGGGEILASEMKANDLFAPITLTSGDIPESKSENTVREEVSDVTLYGEVNAEPSSHWWDHKLIKFLKGRPVEDAIMLGMFSQHAGNSSGYNQDNNIRGFQYKNIFFTSYENSYYRRTHILGLTSNYWRKKFKDFQVGLDVRAATLNAYRNYLPSIGDWSFAVLPTIALSYKTFGVDIWAVPVFHNPVIAASFRINLSDQTQKLFNNNQHVAISIPLP